MCAVLNVIPNVHDFFEYLKATAPHTYLTALALTGVIWPQLSWMFVTYRIYPKAQPQPAPAGRFQTDCTEMTNGFKEDTQIQILNDLNDPLLDTVI